MEERFGFKSVDPDAGRRHSSYLNASYNALPLYKGDGDPRFVSQKEMPNDHHSQII